MRREFVPVLTEPTEKKQTEDEIRSSACSWAAEVVAVDGGYMCFESAEDFKVWLDQE